jgi:hypothetical protein
MSAVTTVMILCYGGFLAVGRDSPDRVQLVEMLLLHIAFWETPQIPI